MATKKDAFAGVTFESPAEMFINDDNVAHEAAAAESDSAKAPGGFRKQRNTKIIKDIAEKLKDGATPEEIAAEMVTENEYIKTRSERMQILVTPKLKRQLKIIAANENTSVNNLVNTALERAYLTEE